MLEPRRSSEAAVPRRHAILGRRRVFGLVLAGAAMLPFAAPVRAQSRLLDAPRAAGVVGERFDGFAVVRGTASPATAALVAQVNAERRALYAQRAASDNVPVEAVGKIYALEIVKAAPPNTWFLSESGQWTQK